MSPEPSLFPDDDRIRSERNSDKLIIALSVQAKEYPQRFLWAKNNAFALEYTPEPQQPALISTHVNSFMEKGVPVRFHCRYFDYEIGNANPSEAEAATQVHLKTIEAIAAYDNPVVTVHLNLRLKIPFDPSRGVANLTRLVEYGRERGVTVCLENLRQGPSSDPDNILDWAEASGAKITLDVGHAVSSEPVKNSTLTVPDIIDMFAARLYEVHMYGKEDDRHYPIDDMARFEPIVDRLLRTDCRWWTIELDDYAEALDTRQKILNYINKTN